MDNDFLKNVKDDRFARLLGIEILDVQPGYALVGMKIEDRHRNGINTVQGGAIFTLADYAFAVASNADGSTTVAINASISFFKAPQGAYLRAEAREEHKNRKICGYKVEIKDEDGTLVASFSGLGYRKLAE
ncbi:MAG: PaaI family thioesterase [Chlorobiaceae bacterium]|nr:PaaI family thioesterase [Chlorobiaceae bacterium]